MPCSSSLMNPSNNTLRTDDHHTKMKDIFSSFDFSNFLHNQGLSDVLSSSDSVSRALVRTPDVSSEFANVFASIDSLAPPPLDDGYQISSSDTATKRRRTSQAKPAVHQDKRAAGLDLLASTTVPNDEGQPPFDSFSQSSTEKSPPTIQDASLMPPSREDYSFSIFRKASDWLSQHVKEKNTTKEEDDTIQTKERVVRPSNKRSLSTAFSSQDWMTEYQPSHVEIKYAPTQVFNSQDNSRSMSWSNSQESISTPFPSFAASKSSTALGSDAKPTGWLQGYYQQVAEGRLQTVKSLPVPDKQESLPQDNKEVTAITTSSNASTGVPSLGLQKTSKLKKGSTSKNSNRRERKKSKNDKSSWAAAMEPITSTLEKKYVEPTDTDVLLGRGGRSNNHRGNKLYREEVQKLKAWYKSSNKHEKTDLSELLVESVRSNLRGRFLQRDDNGKYFEVSKEVARKKASQALREENTPESRKAKREKYGKKNTATSKRGAA